MDKRLNKPHYSDITGPELLMIVWNVIQENAEPFLSAFGIKLSDEDGAALPLPWRARRSTDGSQRRTYLCAAPGLALVNLRDHPDVVVEEVHRDALAITQHPVEQGASITDHAYRLPAVVEVRMGGRTVPRATSGTLTRFTAGFEAFRPAASRSTSRPSGGDIKTCSWPASAWSRIAAHQIR